MTSKSRSKVGTADPFKGLRNVGPATRADLAVLGITSSERLAACDADELYASLQTKTARKQDPCVWDVFAAAIHQARTGEARDWWTFTPVRKRCQALGQFPSAISRGSLTKLKHRTSNPGSM